MISSSTDEYVDIDNIRWIKQSNATVGKMQSQRHLKISSNADTSKHIHTCGNVQVSGVSYQWHCL